MAEPQNFAEACRVLGEEIIKALKLREIVAWLAEKLAKEDPPANTTGHSDA